MFRPSLSYTFCVAAFSVAGIFCSNAAATPAVTSLNPSLGAPQPVGTTITWTAIASDPTPGALWYRFRVGPHNGALHVVKDYGAASTFQWTPSQHEGQFDVEVSVENSVTKAVSGACSTGSACLQTYTVSSRVTGSVPVVTHTPNTLVALYSAPPCATGSTMRVRFRPQTPLSTEDNYDQSTPMTPCTGLSMNFYIAGMRANTTYIIRHDVFSGPRVITGPTLTFATGNTPFTSPSFVAAPAAQLPTSLTNGILLQSNVFITTEFATNLRGNLVWYYTFPNPSAEAYITRPVSGGGAFYVDLNPTLGRTQQFLRMIDPAGNIVLETNAAIISDRLAAMGQPPINGFHHEVRYLPNGDILAISAVEKIFTNGTQGSSAAHPVDVLGDMILVLDPNFNVVWAWNSFDHLDVNRRAVLNETCTDTAGGCPAVYLASVANDWTHGNSAQLTSDGNILYSARHQDLLYKINYANGSGNGSVIWRLGNGGDFTLSPNDPNLWFSHQHDAEFQLGGNAVLSLFDNGNTRVAAHGGNSRGQVWNINETSKTASLALNRDLGVFSAALGTAQRLANGNYHFNAGLVPTFQGGADAFEYTPSGTLVYELQIRPTSTGLNEYRSFRMRDLYTAP